MWPKQINGPRPWFFEEDACMLIIQQCRSLVKRLVYGDTSIPQEFTAALPIPQQEVAVSLHGLGSPFDVSNCHTTACCAPMLIGVSMEKNRCLARRDYTQVFLRFFENTGARRLLGEIHLAPHSVLALSPMRDLGLFSVVGSTNYCLSRLRLWAHYVPQAYSNWRHYNSFDVRMSSLEIRASQVTFIRPHPLVLGSVSAGAGENIFPMNLMGSLGNGHFAFALKDSRRAAHLVENVRRIALSSLPLSLCASAFRLAANHKRESADWAQIPFPIGRSPEFGLPVPLSAGSVMELSVERVQKIGSHTLFIAKMASDPLSCQEPQVHTIHGFYQHWRLQGDRDNLRASVRDDLVNKRGTMAAESQFE
jgi:flavin reductase (DIM6/NTAB) family NADH-FMN oxidoreductase RutF